MIDPILFTQRLRIAVEQSNLDIDEISDETEIRKCTLLSYLSGEETPRDTHTYALSLFLNVSEAWLMGHPVPMERKTIRSLPVRMPDDLRRYIYEHEIELSGLDLISIDMESERIYQKITKEREKEERKKRAQAKKAAKSKGKAQ